MINTIGNDENQKSCNIDTHWQCCILFSVWLFLKSILLALSYFKKLSWNVTIWTMHCICTKMRHEDFSLVLHALDFEDSRTISFNCSSYINILSKLYKHLETSEIYFCSRTPLIELCKVLLWKLYSEVYSESWRFLRKRFCVLLLAVNYFR